MADQSVTIRFRALYESKLAGLQRDIDRVGSSAGQAAGKAGSGLSALAKFSQVAGTALMVGVGAALAVGIKAAIDFESAFAGVRKTVDASEEQFMRLSDSIRNMALEIPITVFELAKIAEMGGQLGIPVDALDEFTDVIAKLGATTNLELDEAATGIARFTNVMGTGLDEFDNMGAAVVDLGNKFATTEKEILTFSTRLAGIGSAVGLTEEEVLGLATAFTSLGEPAERGASALQNTFIRMQDFASSGGPKLKAFADLIGVSVEEAATLIEEDLLGAFVAMERGLRETTLSGGNANEVLDELGLGAIRTTTLLLKGAAGINTVESALRTANDAWAENSALEEEAGKRFETTASQLTLMGNAFTDLRIEIGTQLLPAVKDIIQFFSGFFGVMRDSMPILKTIFAAVAVLAGARGLLKLGTALTGGTIQLTGFNLQGKAMKTWSRPAAASMGNLAGATSMFSTVLSFGVMALGLIAVAMANAKARAQQLESSIDDLAEAIKEFGRTSPEAVDQVMAALELTTAGLIGGGTTENEIQDFLNIIGTSQQNFVKQLTGTNEDFEAFMTESESLVKEHADAMVEAGNVAEGQILFREWTDVAERIRQVRTDLLAEQEQQAQQRKFEMRFFSPEQQRAIEQQAARFKQVMEQIGPEQALLDAIQQAIGPEEDATEIFDEMINVVTEFGGEFADAWADVVEGVKEEFMGWQEAWDGYEQVAAISVQKMRDSLKLWNADQDRLLAANAAVLAEFGPQFLTVWQSLPEDLRRGAAATLAETGPEAFSDLVTMIAEQMGIALEQTDAVTDALMPEAIFDLIANKWPAKLEEAMAGIPEELRGNVELQGIAAKEAWEGFLDSLPADLRLGVEDFMRQMQLEFLGQKDLLFPENWLDMSTEDQLAWLSSQGYDMAEAIALGFTDFNIADMWKLKLLGAAEQAINATRERFGVQSPSKVFKAIGRNVGEGFTLGLEASWPDAFSQMLGRPTAAPMIVPAPQVNVAAPHGPQIHLHNPNHKDDDVIDGVQKGMKLAGIVRMAEMSPGR